jgi:hypothetical protein
VLTGLLAFALGVSGTRASAAEGSANPKARGPLGVALGVELLPSVKSATGAGAVEFLPIELLVFLPRMQRWDSYVAFGAALLLVPPLPSVHARAGVHWIPLGRDQIGPEFGLGVRAVAGLAFSPSKDLLAPQSDKPPQWSFSGFLGEASAGLRVGQASGAGIDVLATLLIGPLSYSATGQPSGLPDQGHAVFYGGTVSLLYDW